MASLDGVDRSNPAVNNPFVCNVCQKTYGRIDHLARHFRSHTNEKPFRCSDCSKTFARADLLKRHATLHTSTEASGKKRKIRASQACSACATIKVKCDQEKPCKRCKTKGLKCRVEPTPNTPMLRSESHGSPSEQWPSPSETRYDPQPAATSHAPNLIYPESMVGVRTPFVPPHSPYRAPPVIVDSSITDFLSQIVHPTGLSSAAHTTQTTTTWNGQFAPRDLMAFSQDISLDFNDLDAALSGNWDAWLDPALTAQVDDKPTVKTVSDMSTPSIDDSINLGTAAYSRSAWRWIPNHEKPNDDHSLASILVDGHGAEQSCRPRPQALTQLLDSADRDRMVALLLASCERPNFQKIVTFFPRTKILDVFLNDHLLHMEYSLDGWLHIPTFHPGEAMPELLTMMIANGATLSKTSHAQRLGYALQAKARVAIYEMWENDLSNTRKLQALQAYAICLETGIWSGNKRTMEMAEAGIYPLTTMIRRQGGFRRSRGVAPGPAPDDTPAALEQKWRTWVEAESFKRLAYHIFILCVQVSVAFQTPPLLSYAEITLELPVPQSLWRARSAEEWRNQYNTLGMAQPLPTFASSMCDASIMGSVRDRIDLQLSLYLVLLSHWCLAWEYTQLSSANKVQASTGSQWAGTLLASSKCQEIRRLLDSFYVAIEAWNVFIPKEVHMTSQLLRMNICVAFEDLQLLAGKEGEEEARRVLPSLKDWFRSPECREAMWHAGQVLRAARRPPGRSPAASHYAPPDTPWLRDFHAVGLYHAGLAFWVYGLIARTIALDQNALHRTPTSNPNSGDYTPAIDYHGDVVRLDGDDEELTAIDRHRFIGLNKGRAVISATSPFVRGAGLGTATSAAARTEALRASRGPNTEAVITQSETVPLDDPKRVLEAIVLALAPVGQPYDSTASTNRDHGPQRPAMVENLIQLLRDFGQAASLV